MSVAPKLTDKEPLFIGFTGSFMKFGKVSGESRPFTMTVEYSPWFFTIKGNANAGHNTVDLDILFRLLKQDMNTADLCHATGHAPALILPRLKVFEEKNMVEKYLQGGDFVWRLKDESDS